MAAMQSRRRNPPEDNMTRRELLLSLSAASLLPGAQSSAASGGTVQTVTGPVPASDLGVTLMHEHIVTDLRAPEERKPGDYDREDAIEKALAHLKELRAAGCRTLVEITPIHIGRDPLALRRLSELSGLRIVAATGIYGAAQQKFIPGYARNESAKQLAERFVREIREGIAPEGIRPGIIKTGVNTAVPLPEIEQKLVRAVALAHKATGLTIASHTGPGAPALEQLRILEAEAVAPGAFIWVHAQNEKDFGLHRRVAQLGAWVEFDGIGPKSVDWHVECVRSMADAGLLERVLISQDAGWYRPGEPGGGSYRGYTSLFTGFLPRLRKAGFRDSDVEQLLVRNPASALARRR
jgi:phosphotriesterase-related protein